MSIRRATLQDILHRCERLAQQGQRLRPGQPPLAALDADGTLWGPDVAELLWQRLISERALNRRAEAPVARALREAGCEPEREVHRDFERLQALHRSGEVPESVMVRVMLEGLVGLTEDDVYLHSTQAISGAPEMGSLRDGLARDLVERLRALGFRVIVVSGSPRWTVEVAAGMIGLDASDVLAGQVAVVEGVLTDGIVEPLPWGKGKVQAILRRYGSVPRISMGNGLGDLPMLEATSDLRILIQPSRELVTACEEIQGATWRMDALSRAAAGRAAAGHAGAGASAAPPRPGRRPTAQT